VRPADLARVLDRRPVAAALSVAALAIPILFVFIAPHVLDQRPGVDFELYRDATSRWLSGGSFYEPYQLAGPYEIRSGDILYPPPMLLVFAPLAVLPAPLDQILYYAIPLGITAAAVVWLRPAPIGWPAILFCLWWPTTVVVIAGGNPGIWLMAFMALGCLWRPLSVLVLLKPTLAPFALFGANRWSWWAALIILAIVSLWFLRVWPDYVTASLNARGGGGIFYSIGQAPMLLLPLAAWATSTRRRTATAS